MADEPSKSSSQERSAALRELVAKWRKNALPHLDRWQCANELEAFIEREAAASLSPQPAPEKAQVLRYCAACQQPFTGLDRCQMCGSHVAPQPAPAPQKGE
jgi:hypothetical protein